MSSRRQCVLRVSSGVVQIEFLSPIQFLATPALFSLLLRFQRLPQITIDKRSYERSKAKTQSTYLYQFRRKCMPVGITNDVGDFAIPHRHGSFSHGNMKEAAASFSLPTRPQPRTAPQLPPTPNHR